LAEEFVIKSQGLEDKINQLLPSQGGFQPGVDLSASTMVIPIVDLTETAEGSSLRQDLQKALSLNSVTSFSVRNTTSTLINTAGYFRVFGVYTTIGNNTCLFNLTDGTTTKKLLEYAFDTSQFTSNLYDFIVFLQAGDSLTADSNNASGALEGSTRQIADLQGNLINPL